MFTCPTAGCILQHESIKPISSINKDVNKQRCCAADNKICNVFGKEFAEKSTRDRHLQLFIVRKTMISLFMLPPMATIVSFDDQTSNVELENVPDELSANEINFEIN